MEEIVGRDRLLESAREEIDEHLKELKQNEKINKDLTQIALFGNATEGAEDVITAAGTFARAAAADDLPAEDWDETLTDSPGHGCQETDCLESREAGGRNVRGPPAG